VAVTVGRPWAVSLRVLLLALLCSLAVMCSTASAISGPWYSGVLQPQQQEGGSSWSNLRQSNGLGSDWVGVAAHLPGGWTLYGSYITGYQNACHAYAAGNTLGPLVMNASIYVAQGMRAAFSTDAPC